MVKEMITEIAQVTIKATTTYHNVSITAFIEAYPYAANVGVRSQGRTWTNPQKVAVEWCC